LNAAAVVWNYQRPPAAGAGRWSAFCGNIESVRALDEQRLEIRLKKSNAAMLADLATPAAGLISPRSPAEGLSRQPVGTGPFRFREWLPGDRIVLDINVGYWGRKSKLGHIVFKTAPESRARLNLLQTGQAQAADGLDPDDLAAARADQNLRVIETPGLNLACLAFNCRKPPMNRVELRQAVAMTVQKTPLIEPVFHGEATVAAGPLPPALCDPKTKVEDWPRDVERARNLIAQLETVTKPITISTNDAFGLKITFTTNIVEHVELPVLKLRVATVPQPYLPDPVRAAGLIKADLETIGLKIQIVASDWNVHLAALRNGDYDLVLHGKISANGDPDDFLGILDPATPPSDPPVNLCLLEDEELAAALKAGRDQTQPAKRAEAYARALVLVRDHLPFVPLAFANDIVVLRTGVLDFRPQPTPGLRLEQVRVK
jgi:peptide/nickel transport system substrate-binding protein